MNSFYALGENSVCIFLVKRVKVKLFCYSKNQLLYKCAYTLQDFLEEMGSQEGTQLPWWSQQDPTAPSHRVGFSRGSGCGVPGSGFAILIRIQGGQK